MRRGLIAPLLAVCLLLGGCWDEIAIESLGFATILAVDGRPGRIHAIVQAVVPESLPNGATGSGNKSQSTANIEGEGPSLYAAVRDADRRAPRRLYFGQLQAVIIGDGLAAAGGVPEVLDYFVRGVETRDIAWVYTASSQDLPALMQVMPINAAYPAEALVDLGIGQRIDGEVDVVRVYELLTRLTGSGHEASVPRITVREGNFALDGTDLFRGARQVGHVGRETSRGLALLSGHAQVPSASAACPAGGQVSIDLLNEKPRFGVRVEGGQAKELWIDFRATAHIAAIAQCSVDLRHTAVRQQVLDLAAARLVQLLGHTVRQLQSQGSDAVGFGEWLEEHSPAVYAAAADHWSDRVFPALPVAIAVHLAPDNSGMLDRSIG